ncbi:hypothetical protein V7S43_014494 [Phytophthora oleae]|uniref:Uncharacterized protein n=1 Tax=Phytophthora oleae TaxID=2107226 RepID=A0ABD3F4K5_9STRA
MSSVVSRLKKILDTLNNPQESSAISSDAFLNKLEEVREWLRMLEKIFIVIYLLNWNQLVGPDQTIPLQSCEDAILVLSNIQEAIEQATSRLSKRNNIQRLSSSRASEASIQFFYRQTESLLNILNAPQEVCQAIEKYWVNLRKS